MRPHVIIALLATALLSASAIAAGAPHRVKYVPPDGFAGHKWGDLRSSFERLSIEPLGVGAAWINPVLTDQHITCIGICDQNQVLLSIWNRYEGGGFYVLSEYSVDGQGFQFGNDDSVQFYPVVYQFCANWYATKKTVPPDFAALNRFCGVKLSFQSETRADLRRLPADYVTVYDRVLDKLLARYGKPDSFLRRGTVVIDTLDGITSDTPERKFRVYRWCPAFDRRFRTPCEASVVLSIDPESGTGTVFYSTQLLWEYAYARQNNGFKGDKLFKVLHARR